MTISIVSIAVYVVVLIVLIFLSSRFSGTETALTSLNEIDLAEIKEKKIKNFKYIEKLVSDMDSTIIAILVGNNLVNVLASSLAAILFQGLLGNIGVSISVGVMTFLLLVFGEITPKAYALKNNFRISSKNARMIYVIFILLGGLIKLLKITARTLSRWFGQPIPKDEFHLQEKNIKLLAKKGAATGEIKSIEKEIIYRVFSFGDLKVKDIMIPAKKVKFLKGSTTVVEAKKAMVYYGYTRLPVVEGVRKRRIIGIIYTKDLLNRLEGRIRDFIRDPYIVPPGREITQVFEEMRKKRVHLGVVSDKKKRFLGIMTLEDIMEELVGEIYDEFDSTPEESEDNENPKKKRISRNIKGLSEGLGISRRMAKRLIEAGFFNIGDITKDNKSSLMKIKGLNEKKAFEIIRRAEKYSIK